jgi:signal transduction histidine kinase
MNKNGVKMAQLNNSWNTHNQRKNPELFEMKNNSSLPPSSKEPRPKILSTIRGRLFLLLLAVLVPIFVVQASIYYDRFRFERNQGYETNLELARAVAENLQHFIRDVSHQELAIGLALTSPNPLPPQQVDRLLVENEKEYEAVRDFAWVDAHGRVVASSLKRAVHADLSDRPYFRETAGGSKTVVSDLIIARVTGGPIFTISRGIRDEKGEFVGAVVAVVEPHLLGDMLAFRRAHQGAIGIVDRNGMGVSRYPEIKWTWKERFLLDRFPLIREALKGKEITFTTHHSLDGTERILACVPIPSIGWAAAASVPAKAVTGPVISNLLYHAAWFLLVTSAGIVFAFIISRRISIPVKNLRDQALALGRGELNHRVEARGMEEMEDLARSFNTMADEIRARQMQVEERAKALDEAHNRIRDILNSVTDGFMSVSRDFKFSYVNDAGAKFLGRSSEEIIGKPVFDAFPEAKGTVFEECFRKGLEQRAILSLEDFYPPLESWLECRCYPSADGISIFFTDTTLRRHFEQERERLLEELEQRVQQRTAELQRANAALQARANELQLLNTELQDFAFVASHDLKEPLRKIQTFGSLLREKHHDQLGDRGRDYLFRIEAAAFRMQSLLEALLSYSRITTRGRSFKPVELNDVVGEAANDLELAIQKAEGHLDVAPLPTVNGDRHQLRQLFQNLIANAITFRRSGVIPEVNIYSRSMDEGYQIFIQDNGIGFDEKYLDLIFKPFQRLHGRSEYEGTGMGLAICRKIMERHGGRISVNSTPGKGSVFQVTFPLMRMQEGEQEVA